MEKGSNPVYDKNTLEFVTVAFEFCSWMESVGHDLPAFVDKATKLLPLLYLKATLLPDTEADDDAEVLHFVTEETYHALRDRLAALLGEYDTYLETFAPDMQYSDTPVAAFISENLSGRAMKKRCVCRWHSVRRISGCTGDNRSSTP